MFAQLLPGTNAEMMKRYGLIPKNALVQVTNNEQSSTNMQMPPNLPAQSTINQTPSVRSIEMMKCYGLMPQNTAVLTTTNSPASEK